MVVDLSKTVLRGQWLYAGEVSRQIVVLREELLPGSGDYEDPPDIADDRLVTCYAVWFETDPGVFTTGAGSYEALSEAITQVERLTSGAVSWLPYQYP